MAVFRGRSAEKRLAKSRSMKRISLISILSLSCLLIYAPSDAKTASNDCVVLDWQIARTVKNGISYDRRREFNRDDKRVYAFISLNCTRIVSNLRFLFVRNGKMYALVKLPLRPSKRWRTWASVQTLKGKWLVKVYAGSRFLLSDSFVVR